MATALFRPRNLKNSRSWRKRNDSDEDSIFVDWSKEPKTILEEILWHIVQRDNVSKTLKLGYLNCFTKFCIKVDNFTEANVGFTLDEIFCCLRVSLFHDSVEVRAAGLRAMRYLLKNEESSESLCRVNIPYLICRSIDIVLDNKMERIQGLRLVRKLLSLNAKRFPPALARCLIAIARDGLQERDILVRASWATLAELLLLNPIICAETNGISAILSSILQGTQPHHISEALISSILYLLNGPKYRYLIRGDQDLQQFIAPFTDFHFALPLFASPKGAGAESVMETVEQSEAKFVAAKNALTSVLRSWSGVIYLCRSTSDGCYNGLQSLLEMLHLPYAETRRHIMELIFELFILPVPEYTDDFNQALLSIHSSTMQESWQLVDGFVAAEGRAILPCVTKHRQNLLDNYLAILLYAFVCYGVLDSLVSVIIIPDGPQNCVRATVLLGELLHLSSQLLPPEIAQRCHSLPKLLDAATSVDSTLPQRDTATTAITNLYKIHCVKKSSLVPCSLYLDQLLQFCNPLARKTFYNSAVSKSKIRLYMRKENDEETVLISIKHTMVLVLDNFTNWDWNLIGSILRWPGDSLKKFEDVVHKSFIRKLLNFYKPTSKLFSLIDNEYENAREFCVVGCHLIDFLVEAEESKAVEYLDDLLLDLGTCFSQIAVEDAPSNAILSPTRMLATLSHAYFLFIGRLSSSSRGKKSLEKAGIYQYLLDLISLSSHEAYTKLIVSSLDYTQEGHFTRTLLTKVLTASLESARLYATNYMRVLLRAEVQDFRKWALELLTQQLCDKSPAVVIAAAEILDEALDSDSNLESIISLRPSLLHIGDAGLLLLIRYLSSPVGFKFLSDANFLNYELERWQKSFNLKYVNIVESILNEALTCHQRSEDGTYGRRSDRRVLKMQTAFIPPHLYGQLAKHDEGVQLLIQHSFLPPMYKIIQEADISTDFHIFQLKAGLWAVGNVAASSLGFQLVYESEVIPYIVNMAADSPVLSVRGTCFYVLGLIASTSDGADYLKDYGWDSIRHCRNDSWPLVKDHLKEKMEHVLYPLAKRGHTWSASSGGTRITDLYAMLSDSTKGLRSVDSFVYNGTTEEEPDILYSSLPVLEGERLFGSLKHGTTSDQLLKPQRNLSRVSSLSPQHCSSLLETRPRSSSDCQQRNCSETLGVVDVDDSDGSSGIWMKERSNESVLQSGGSSDTEALQMFKSEKHDSGFVLDGSGHGNVLQGNSSSSMQLSISGERTPITVQAIANRRKLVLSKTTGARRKISDPFGMYSGFSNNNTNAVVAKSDIGDVVTKSRSESFAESTSGVSYCDSSMTATAFNQLGYLQKLSPIASLSSISNNLQCAKSSSMVSHYSTLPRTGSSLTYGSPPGQDSPVSFESIPSAADATGYATLRAIQRRRVRSLGIHHPSFPSDDLGDDLNDDMFGSGLESDTISKTSSTPEPNERPDETTQSESSASDHQKYMGISLPLSLDFILVVPSSQNPQGSSAGTDLTLDQSKTYRTHLEKMPADAIFVNSGLDLHTESNCLLCFKLDALRLAPSVSISEVGDVGDVETLTEDDSSLRHLLGRRRLTVGDVEHAASSFTSSSSVEAGLSHCGDASFTNRVYVRREVVRFVTNLSGSVTAKSSEQGLLNLKQKFPSAFQDVCLYSEVCLHIASYGFRLPARRFLQELFLDLNFDQLYSSAEATLKKHASFDSEAAATNSVFDVSEETSKNLEP